MPEDELTAIAKQEIDAAVPEGATLTALVIGLKLASQRLQASLVPVLGSLGVRSLTELAIRRVAERYPFLHGVAVREDGIDAAEVLGRKSDADYEEVRESFEDLLATFLRLLGGLVGSDLAMALLREEDRNGR